MTNDEMINRIRYECSDEDLLCQLAEECSELAQAALKMRRVITGTNPTPVTEAEAMQQINEEIADTLLVLRMLGYPHDQQAVERMQNRKLTRWVYRLLLRKD